jgi:hypothetical protein
MRAAKGDSDESATAKRVTATIDAREDRKHVGIARRATTG